MTTEGNAAETPKFAEVSRVFREAVVRSFRELDEQDTRLRIAAAELERERRREKRLVRLSLALGVGSFALTALARCWLDSKPKGFFDELGNARRERKLRGVADAAPDSRGLRG